MIVYDLCCVGGHGFEGWFASSTDFDNQQESGLLRCPVCDTAEVTKAPMAPAVASRKEAEPKLASSPANVPVANIPLPPQLQEAFRQIARAQAKALEKSEWVGARFAEEVRAQHYGEKEEAPVHGKASADEALALTEEGIAIAPLLVPVIEPDELN